jgi:tetratricopeptide (TPR) repeat protein
VKRSAVLLIVILVSTLAFGAETKLGTVKSFSGTVTIDAFGKGVFIPVVKGDTLYTSTVLKTGPNGRATVDLQGQTKEIPPGAEVKVADLAAAGQKKSGLGWFAAVGKLITSFTEASKEKEGDLVLGSRAADVSQEQSSADMEWEVEETDPAVLLPEARKSIDAGGYAAALEKLAKADPPTDPALAWDLSFWKGFCYFQMEDYADAALSLSAARSLAGGTKTPLGTPTNQAMLLFQLGSSYYLLGKEKEAIPALEAYLSQDAEMRYAGYASLLLAKSLVATGNATRARSIANDALKKHKGTDLEAEFSALLK